MVTAVAVAWVFAAGFKRLGMRRGELDGWVVPGELVWPTPVPAGWPTELEWTSAASRPDNRGKHRAFPHRVTVFGRDYFHMESWGPVGREYDEPREPMHLAERETFGWPWRAFQVVTMEDELDLVRTDALRSLYQRGVELRARTNQYDRPPVLPLRPVWAGLIGDAAVYGAAWWSVLAVPGLRRRWRARHGRCGACGYPRGAAAVCTECGTAVTPGASASP
jgi:hypothetical protein